MGGARRHRRTRSQQTHAAPALEVETKRNALTIDGAVVFSAGTSNPSASITFSGEASGYVKFVLGPGTHTLRRESSNHREYCFRYFNLARPHHGIRQRVPVERVLKPRADPASVVSVPVLGGLHHDYRAAA